MAEIIKASVPLDGGAAAGAKEAAGSAPGAPPAGDKGAAPAAAGAAPGGAPAGDDTPAAPINPAELATPPKEASKEEAPKPEGEAGAKSEDQQNVEKATGLDLTPYAQEWDSTGKLSDKSYSDLEKGGLSREVVDTYIEGLRARVTARLNSYAEAVGGVENYNAILNWGKTGLTEGERAEAVKVLSGTNADAAKLFLAGLQAKFVQANGRVPGKIAGGGAAPAADVFSSRAEQAKAMRDPRYKTDPAYRDEIAQKSIRSFGSGAQKKRVKKAAPNSRRRHRAKR